MEQAWALPARLAWCIKGTAEHRTGLAPARQGWQAVLQVARES